MITCKCPAASELPTIGTSVCAESFGQIQKVAFVRLYDSSNDTENKFSLPTASTGSIEKKASWTAKLSNTGDQKVVVSPFVQAPTDEGGDAITFGGGNDTLGGIEMVIGSNPVTFSGVFRAISQSKVKNLKKLMCEAQGGNLGIFLFDENGNIEGIEKSDGVYPIPIRALFVGDKIHGGLEAPDSNAISWQYAPNYSDNLKIYTPSDFNPLDFI